MIAVAALPPGFMPPPPGEPGGDGTAFEGVLASLVPAPETGAVPAFAVAPPIAAPIAAMSVAPPIVARSGDAAHGAAWAEDGLVEAGGDVPGDEDPIEPPAEGRDARLAIDAPASAAVGQALAAPLVPSTAEAREGAGSGRASPDEGSTAKREVVRAKRPDAGFVAGDAMARPGARTDAARAGGVRAERVPVVAPAAVPRRPVMAEGEATLPATARATPIVFAPAERPDARAVPAATPLRDERADIIAGRVARSSNGPRSGAALPDVSTRSGSILRQAQGERGVSRDVPAGDVRASGAAVPMGRIAPAPALAEPLRRASGGLVGSGLLAIDLVAGGVPPVPGAAATFQAADAPMPPATRAIAPGGAMMAAAPQPMPAASAEFSDAATAPAGTPVAGTPAIRALPTAVAFGRIAGGIAMTAAARPAVPAGSAEIYDPTATVPVATSVAGTTTVRARPMTAVPASDAPARSTIAVPAAAIGPADAPTPPAGRSPAIDGALPQPTDLPLTVRFVPRATARDGAAAPTGTAPSVEPEPGAAGDTRERSGEAVIGADRRIEVNVAAPGIAPAPEIARAAPADGATGAPAAATADTMLRHHLDVAHDGAWLDRLARDIAVSADRDQRMRFQLNPERLGTLHVEIAGQAEGATVRFTADSEAARALIAEAQPRLVAEARAQGMRIAETQVDLSGQGGAGAGAGGFAQQQQHAQQQGGGQRVPPFERPATAMTRPMPGGAAERPARAERYA